MYNTYFGFREKPFKLVPNPDFLYLSKNHEIALAHLSYAVSQGDGFVVITGEVGTGKTTLCRIFLERLEEGIESAYIFNPRLDSVQLLTTICNEFGIHTNCNNLKQLLDVINGYLIMKNKAGRKVILLIDEAQNLSVENLEMVRMLSNLETTRNKLLQIILVGQPELGDMLDSYELRQLAQRISLSAHLTPLTNAETAGYIGHRILIAAQRQLDLFTPGACRLIHKFSRGIPRKINIAADRALLTAYSLNRAKVTSAVAKIAIEELLSSRPAAPATNTGMSRTMLWGALICSILLMAAGVYAKRDAFLWGGARAADSGQIKTGAQAVRTFKIDNHSPPIAPAVSINPSSGFAQTDLNPTEGDGAPLDIAEVINTLEHESSRLDAMKFVLQKWKQAPPSAYQLPPMAIDPEYFEIAARQYGLRMYTAASDWALVKQMNLPAIITIKKHRSAELVYLAMVGWSGGQIQLALNGRQGLVQTDLESLLPHTQGTVYVYWKNTLGFDPVINATSPPQAIQAVKKMLRQVGYDNLIQEGSFDRATEKAVLDFQLRHSLTPDGLVGSLTKIFLINEAQGDDNEVYRPRLYGDSEGREGA